MVRGHQHGNEARLLPAENGLYFLSATGRCTTFFDEFYYDPFRRKLLCVGSAVAAPEQVFHYLMSDDV
jgi:hypothetical protein